jgi:hypothetical protein
LHIATALRDLPVAIVLPEGRPGWRIAAWVGAALAGVATLLVLVFTVI